MPETSLHLLFDVETRTMVLSRSLYRVTVVKLGPLTTAPKAGSMVERSHILLTLIPFYGLQHLPGFLYLNTLMLSPPSLVYPAELPLPVTSGTERFSTAAVEVHSTSVKTRVRLSPKPSAYLAPLRCALLLSTQRLRAMSGSQQMLASSTARTLAPPLPKLRQSLLATILR